jgi:metallophosphoesterase superfamily enzyme
MDRVATSLNSQFVVALGDNFYSEGVTDEHSTRFDKTFESIYTGDSLQTPWYVIAGNHGRKRLFYFIFKL